MIDMCQVDIGREALLDPSQNPDANPPRRQDVRLTIPHPDFASILHMDVDGALAPLVPVACGARRLSESPLIYLIRLRGARLRVSGPCDCCDADCKRGPVSAILPVMGAKRAKKQNGDGGAQQAPHYLGHRKRLRERFVAAGPDAVSDYELLELVLYSAIPRVDIKPLAKELL